MPEGYRLIIDSGQVGYIGATPFTPAMNQEEAIRLREKIAPDFGCSPDEIELKSFEANYVRGENTPLDACFPSSNMRIKMLRPLAPFLASWILGPEEQRQCLCLCKNTTPMLSD